MKAVLLEHERSTVGDGIFVEIVIWRVPISVRGSWHHFKYSLVLVSEDRCVLRYDNESGKGDHKHIDEHEVPYEFSDIKTLRTHFRQDVEEWLKRRGP